MVEVSSWKVGVLFLIAAIGTNYVYQRLYSLPLKMDGYSDHRFRDAAQSFRRLIQNEDERGASFAVYFRGQKVLEMLGGYSDPEAELPWSSDTLTQVYSLSSVTSALSLLHLTHSGNFNHSSSVKEYWPAFEGDLTGSELVQHKHGLYSLPERLPFRDVVENTEKLDAVLKIAHSVSFADAYLDTKFATTGLYLDALLRHADPKHRSVSQYFHDEIAYPLGLDAQLGLPRTQFSRAARLQLRLADGFWSALWHFDLRQMWRALGRNYWWILATDGIFEDFKLRWAMRPELMEVGHPSLSLFTNARSLSRLFATIAGRGAIDGRQLLPSRIFDDFLLEDASGFDRVLSRRVSYNKAGFELRKSPAQTTMVGFYGYGGQIAFADLEKDLAFAYTTNYLHSCSAENDWMVDLLIQSVYACVAGAGAK